MLKDGDLDDDELREYKRSRIIINVLAYNRLDSLKRCLASLAEAYYDTDKVDLNIFVDHVDATKIDLGSSRYTKKELQLRGYNVSTLTDEDINTLYLESLTSPDDIVNGTSSDRLIYLNRERALAESQKIMAFLTLEFKWQYGRKNIHYRSTNAGLQMQWLENWFPSSMNEFAYVVEDDIVVSKYFYRYLKRSLKYWYYSKAGRDDRVFGISTQKQAQSVGLNEKGQVRWVEVYNRNKPFLFGSVGSWGTLFFPKHWIMFRLWFDRRKAIKDYSPHMTGIGKSQMNTNNWYRVAGDKIWTPWFLKFCEQQRWYSIYVNFQSRKYLSASYRDVGVSYQSNEGINAPIAVEENDVEYAYPPISSLNCYDACMIPSNLGEIFRWNASSFSTGRDLQYSVEFKLFLQRYSVYRHYVVVTYGAEDENQFPLYLDHICAIDNTAISRKVIFVTGNEKVATMLSKKGVGVILVEIDSFKKFGTAPSASNASSLIDFAFKNLTGIDVLRRITMSLETKGDSMPDAFSNSMKGMRSYFRNQALSQMNQHSSAQFISEGSSRMDRSLDILLLAIMDSGYNILLSHYRTKITSWPFEKIFSVGRTGFAMWSSSITQTDVFFSSYSQIILNPLEFKEKPIRKRQEDHRLFAFLTRSKALRKVFKDHVSSQPLNSNDYENALNKIYREMNPSDLTARDNDVKENPSEFNRTTDLSNLRAALLPANVASSFYEKVKKFSGLPSEYHPGSVAVVGDVECCSKPVERVHGNLNLKDYFTLLSKNNLNDATELDFMCAKKTCFSDYYKWTAESRMNAFDDLN